MDRELPIGVFDSGVGGLTVLEAISRQLPQEHLLYLGDTARVPYGTRSPETVVRYAERVSGHLYRRGIKALVVACNTATTWAIERLRAAGTARGIPVLGVIEPGIQAALRETTTEHIGIIGTEGTIQGGVYRDRLRSLRPDVQISQQACPLFVALAEEGWTEGEVPTKVAERYLAHLSGGPDTLILGCTHYPLLKSVIRQILPGVALVDSADSTAEALAKRLQKMKLLRTGSVGTHKYLVTDNVDRFRRTGAHFLKRTPDPVELSDLEVADEMAFTIQKNGLQGRVGS